MRLEMKRLCYTKLIMLLNNVVRWPLNSYCSKRVDSFQFFLNSLLFDSKSSGDSVTGMSSSSKWNVVRTSCVLLGGSLILSSLLNIGFILDYDGFASIIVTHVLDKKLNVTSAIEKKRRRGQDRRCNIAPCAVSTSATVVITSYIIFIVRPTII